MKFLLDTGVLGEFCHPNTKKYLPKINLFLDHVEQGKDGVFIPEIADYELRRELLRFAMRNNQTNSRSLERLDNLVRVYGFEYLPMTTPMWRQAAELWAQARNLGQPIADPKELGGDVILAAQALSVGGVVITTNVKHLARFVVAKGWDELIEEWTAEMG